MKFLTFIFALALLVACWPSPIEAAGGLQSPVTLIVTNTSTTATKKVSATVRKFKTATLIGLRSPGVTNTTMVYIGTSTNSQPYGISPGGVVTVTSQPGEFYTWSDFWMSVSTVNDGITIIYTPEP